jgi:hypothetical protein
MAGGSRFPIELALDCLDADLGHRHLNKVWAKVEILFGLFALGSGLLFGIWAMTKSADFTVESMLISLSLYALGGYLTLAGNRSHLYQSNNRLTAYLAELMRQANKKD